MHDAEFQRALAHNLDGTFEQLVLSYQDRLYAFALRLLGNAQDAEEAVQDALVRSYHALAGYEAERTEALALRPWLYQIVLNVVRNRVRRKRLPVVPLGVYADGEEDGGAWELADDEQGRPPAIWERAEQSAELAALVEALPERYRAAVVLRHVAGLGYVELASILGQPVGTAKANVHRGVAQLRQALTQQMSEEGINNAQYGTQ